LNTKIKTNPFRKIVSQYRANNSDDLVVLPAACVTALLLMNFTQALKLQEHIINTTKMIFLLYREQPYNHDQNRILRGQF
jgi:hypothetical protein